MSTACRRAAMRRFRCTAAGHDVQAERPFRARQTMRHCAEARLRCSDARVVAPGAAHRRWISCIEEGVMEQTMHHHDAGFATQQVQRVEASRPLFWRSHGAGARDPRDSRIRAGRIGRPSSPQAALTSTTEVIRARRLRASSFSVAAGGVAKNVRSDLRRHSATGAPDAATSCKLSRSADALIEVAS